MRIAGDRVALFGQLISLKKRFAFRGLEPEKHSSAVGHANG